MAAVRTDSEGRVYATLSAVNVLDTFAGGLRFAPNGALRVDNGSAIVSYNGEKPQDANGALCIGPGLPPQRPYDFNGAIPTQRVLGRVVAQIDQVPAPSDPFIAGVRVGPLGGVYLTSAVPP